MNVLKFWVIYLNFSKITIILILLSSTWFTGSSLIFNLVSFLLRSFLADDVFHVLYFRLFVLVINMIVVRASWMMMVNNKLVTFTIYLCNHLIRLCNCRLWPILGTNSTSRSSTPIWRWRLWNCTYLFSWILNIWYFKLLCSTCHHGLFLPRNHPIRIIIGWYLWSVCTFRSSSTSSCIFLVLVKRPVFHRLHLLLLMKLILTVLFMNFGALLVWWLTIFDLLLSRSKALTLSVFMSCSGTNSTWWRLSIQFNLNFIVGIVGGLLMGRLISECNWGIWNCFHLSKCQLAWILVLARFITILFINGFGFLLILTHWFNAVLFLIYLNYFSW